MNPIPRRNLLMSGLAAGALAGAGSAPLALAQSGRGAAPQPFRAARLPRPRLLEKPAGAVWFAPAPPAYPQDIPHARLIADAMGYSGALQAYIEAWMDGRVGPDLPRRFVPPGVNREDYPRFTLQRVEEADPALQWVVREAHTLDSNALYGGFPDPNCTYLIAVLFAPFGCRLTMEGEYPRARFFDVQITPSFDPRSYRYDGGVGVPETPIVDADIEPLPGHVNPFRVGARRDASERGYRLEFDLAMGDPTQLDRAMNPPYFRGPGNRRTGGALFFQGPWGAYRGIGGHGRGPWDVGYLWTRYYRPDDGTGALAAAPLPRLAYTLPDGRAFWLQADASGLDARANRTVTVRAGTAEPEEAEFTTSRWGWGKQVGIFRSIISGLARNTGFGSPEYVRLLDQGVAGRGHEMSPPNDYEQSATSCTYIDYLVRSMTCGEGKVVTLTGRLPATPRTRAGATHMEAGEARYWSLVGYYIPDGWDFLAAFAEDAVNGVAQHAVMDEEIVLRDDRRYVICLSRAQDRPANARAENGVTWVDWGAAPKVSWTLRWMTVGPEWTAPNAPTKAKVGPHGDWANPLCDEQQMIQNNRGTGILGAYQPVVGYLPKAAFEALGPRVSWRNVPAWRG